MRISGLQKLTLLDYPGHIACTIFTGYCNLRCPFCHNYDLVSNPEKFPEYSRSDIYEFLEERKGKIEGVAVTGGEPLINDNIDFFLSEIKKMGFKIKLDTNGFFPDKLKNILDNKLIDMVAMDIKSGTTNYLKVSGIDDKLSDEEKIIEMEKVKKSISLIKNSDIEYEFRTTCVKGLHSENDFYEIKDMILGAKKYFLQNYREPEGITNLPFSSFTREELEKFVSIIKDSVSFIDTRGVD